MPLPKIKPGEALVRVLAAGVNNTDIATREGWYAREGTEAGGWAGALTFPRIQGGDLCGRVEPLGAEARGPEVGARVICPINQPVPRLDKPYVFEALGSQYDGAFAEFCVVPADRLYDVTASPLSDV